MEESIEFVDRKIKETNTKIEKNIDDSVDDRGYMSQNIIKSLRDLIEYISFKVYVIEQAKCYCEYNHVNIQQAIAYIKSLRKHDVLKDFHSLLQIGPSHNSYSEDGSIRLMIKYQEYLVDLRNYYYKNFNEKILTNLFKFPIFKIDPSLRNYYEEIYKELVDIDYDETKAVFTGAYYIIKTKPIVLDDKKRIFYEITLTPATDYINKFNRIILYSPVRIPDNYAIKLSYVRRSIRSFNSEVEIKIINNYMVFIKPAEINSLYKIFGVTIKTSYRSNEYKYFMELLKTHKVTLNDIINFDNDDFELIRKDTDKFNTHHIFKLLEKIRFIVKRDMPGCNVLKFLIYMLRNYIIVDQLASDKCEILSNMFLKYGCAIFEKMPYASSLVKHKIAISDLFTIIDPNGREHEFFGRRINDLCNLTNRIYFSFDELGYTKEEAERLVNEFNSRVYYKHKDRYLKIIGDKVYISGFEASTIAIISKLKEKAKEKYSDYEELHNLFVCNLKPKFDDQQKEEICKKIYIDSKVGLIYGSAGTGKTEMIKIISEIFIDKNIVFLAKTNAALNNIKLRLGTQSTNKYDFYTVDKFSTIDYQEKYDLMVIDECSMVENNIMLTILDKNNYDCLLLVGDIYQIEAIDFGNWFRFAKELIDDNSHELTENFRTTNHGLKNLWSKVRNLDEGITEKTIDEDYSEVLSESIFESREDSEIVLCLNYDGPYGINNINRYLQATNSNELVEWGVNTYKVGDPIIFSDVGRFSNVLYNNLKGKIHEIHKNDDYIVFDLIIDKVITPLEANIYGINVMDSNKNQSVIRIEVYKKTDDDNDDDVVNVVPFFVSYATSIHKSQGLEFDSVKIIVSDEAGELITKNILYTAITRSKKKLKIYWSPECQNKVIKNMKDYSLKSDVALIRNRMGCN